jgi:hypothetical protein
MHMLPVVFVCTVSELVHEVKHKHKPEHEHASEHDICMRYSVAMQFLSYSVPNQLLSYSVPITGWEHELCNYK